MFLVVWLVWLVWLLIFLILDHSHLEMTCNNWQWMSGLKLQNPLFAKMSVVGFLLESFGLFPHFLLQFLQGEVDLLLIGLVCRLQVLFLLDQADDLVSDLRLRPLRGHDRRSDTVGANQHSRLVYWVLANTKVMHIRVPAKNSLIFHLIFA